ncbi:hypothetical protein, partial [Pseudomonas syringae]|uniref:hypothetical protein n=1 Tax=Pseudomonas syringae TaxID=317 RepID=UPI001E52F21A
SLQLAAALKIITILIKALIQSLYICAVATGIEFDPPTRQTSTAPTQCCSNSKTYQTALAHDVKNVMRRRSL